MCLPLLAETNQLELLWSDANPPEALVTSYNVYVSPLPKTTNDVPRFTLYTTTTNKTVPLAITMSSLVYVTCVNIIGQESPPSKIAAAPYSTPLSAYGTKVIVIPR